MSPVTQTDSGSGNSGDPLADRFNPGALDGSNFGWARVRYGDGNPNAGAWEIAVDPTAGNPTAGEISSANAQVGTYVEPTLYPFTLDYNNGTPNFSFSVGESSTGAVSPVGINPGQGPQTLYIQGNLNSGQTIALQNLKVNGTLFEESIILDRTGGIYETDAINGNSASEYNWFQYDLGAAGGSNFQSLTGNVGLLYGDSFVANERPSVTFAMADPNTAQEVVPTPSAAVAGLVLLGGVMLRRRRRHAA